MNLKPLDDRIAEVAHERRLDPLPLRQGLGGESVVAEGTAPDELGVADLLESGPVQTRGVQRADDGADARADDPVDVQTGILELAQDPDKFTWEKMLPRKFPGFSQLKLADFQRVLDERF